MFTAEHPHEQKQKMSATGGVATSATAASTSSHARDLKKIEEKYFTPSEVEFHNSEEDLWMSWLGYVYDLTSLAAAHKDNPLLLPLLKNAGRDISHWFDPKTGDLKTYTHPMTSCTAYFCPEGRFLHVPPPLPRSDWNADDVQTPWWLDKQRYCVGRLSKKTRKLRIVNTLTHDEHILEVCNEEKLTAIQDRYLAYNAHAKGYMWKRLGALLDMSQTLEGNGIKDESMSFDKVGMNEDEWLPIIHLYFSDDLTVA